MDKRYLRSEYEIKKSFNRLLSQKDLNEITVSDICREATCSRNTFYIHYDNKEHLMLVIMDELIQSIEESCQPVVKQFHQIDTQESKKFTNQILSAIHAHKSLIKGFLTQNNSEFTQRLANVLINTSIKEAEKINQPYHIPHLIYFMNGIVGFIQYWIENDFSLQTAQEQLHDAIHFSFKK